MTENVALIYRTMVLLKDVEFETYRFEVFEAHGGVVLRATYLEADVYSGKEEMQSTRKWVLSPHMTNSEIVQTAFKACLTSMEHRCREHFLYRGARVYGPHFDVEDLVAICRSRENAGGRPRP